MIIPRNSHGNPHHSPIFHAIFPALLGYVHPMVPGCHFSPHAPHEGRREGAALRGRVDLLQLLWGEGRAIAHLVNGIFFGSSNGATYHR